ncbi:hypothetical protein ACTFIR_002073 [Dictyostelium discoideum]
MEKLFFKVWKNNILRKLIFSYIIEINKRKIGRILKYYEIKSADILCDNGYWLLLKDIVQQREIRRKQKEEGKPCYPGPSIEIKITESSLIKICKGVSNIDLFKSLYYQLETEFKYHDFMFIDYAADSGSLEVVKFLHEKGHSASFVALDNASWRGHFEIIKFLIHNRHEQCSKGAIDQAAAEGNLPIVKYLSKYTQSGCSKSAINLACKNGHLEMVKYLFENRKEGASAKALDYCCEFGRFEIFKYLFENDVLSLNNMGTTSFSSQSESQNSNGHNKQYITVDGLKLAVKSGNLQLVKYMIDNKIFIRSDCNIAYQQSLSQRNCEIIKLLEQFSSERITTVEFIMYNIKAIENKLLNNIIYLFDKYPKQVLSSTQYKELIYKSVQSSDFQIFQFIFQNAIKKYPTFLQQTLKNSSSPSSSSSSSSSSSKGEKNHLNEKYLFMLSIRSLNLEIVQFIYNQYHIPSYSINIQLLLSFSIYNFNIPITDFLISNFFINNFYLIQNDNQDDHDLDSLNTMYINNNNSYKNSKLNLDNYLLSPIIRSNSKIYNYLLNCKNNILPQLQLQQIQQPQPQPQPQPSNNNNNNNNNNNTKKQSVLFINNENYKLLYKSNISSIYDEIHISNPKYFKIFLTHLTDSMMSEFDDSFNHISRGNHIRFVDAFSGDHHLLYGFNNNNKL